MKKQTINYKVNIKKNDERTYLDFSKDYFSDIAPYYGKDNKKVFYRSPLYDFSNDDEFTVDGIYGRLSLIGLEYVINNYHTKYYGKNVKKDKSLAILKLILEGGTSSTHAVSSAPFLFFDIDVKDEVKENGELKQENFQLFHDKELNQKVFDFMESISVLTFRSSSGKGMAGILYVPILADSFIMKEENRKEHIIIGEKINEFINNNLDIPCKITFDNAQNKFRQLRYIPAQKNKLKLNPYYYEFDVEREIIEEIQVISNKEFFLEKKDNNIKSKKYLTIEEYNKNNLCQDFLETNYEYVRNNLEANKLRFNRKGGDSSSVLVYQETNTFHDFKGDIKGSKPFDLYVHFNFKGNKKEAIKSLKPKANNKLTEEEYEELLIDSLGSPWLYFLNQQFFPEMDFRCCVKNFIDSFNEELNPMDKEFKTIKEIRDFAFRYPYERLLNDNNITETKSLKYDEYIDPDWLINSMSKYINIVISGCGTGKTTAFLNHKYAICKHKKVLFLVPRTIMVNQQVKGFKQNYKIVASSSGECSTTNSNVTFTNSLTNNQNKLFSSEMFSDGKNNCDLDYNKLDMKELKSGLKSGVITYDQFNGINIDILNLYDYICIDESHILSSDTSFRFDVIQNTLSKVSQLKNGKSAVKFILLTATPGLETNILYHFYKNDCKIIDIKKEHKFHPYVTAVNVNKSNKQKVIFQRILKSVNENRKVIMLVNSKNKILTLWKGLEKYCESKGVYSPKRASVTSEIKNGNIYKTISEEESLGKVELLFTTSLLEVGVNIDMNCDIDFIFDYTDAVCHTDAKNALQLIYRNRNRKTHVYCYASMFDGNTLINNSLGNHKVFKPLEEVLNSKSFMENLKYNSNLSSLQFNNLDVENSKEVDIVAQATKEITSNFKNFEKQLGAFLILASKHGCHILFDFFEKDEKKSEPVSSKVNDFVVNTLNAFMSIKTERKIKVSPIINSDFTSNNVDEHFKIVNTKSSNGDILIDALYHSVYHDIVNSLEFQFNYLKIFYRQDISTVFNYIFNSYRGVNFSKKINNYIQTHKHLSKEQRMVASFIEEKFQENIEYETASMMSIKLEIKDMISKRVKDDLISKIESFKNAQLVKSIHNYFDESFNKYLLEEIDSTLKKIFNVKKAKRCYQLDKKYVLDFHSKYDFEENDSAEMNIIESFLTISNDSLLSSFEDNLNTKLLFSSSVDSTYDNLYSRRLKRYSKGVYGNGSITWMLKQDYFSTNSLVNEDISIEYIWDNFSYRLNLFKNRKENKRARNCYVSICRKTNDIVIAKTKKSLYDSLLSDGVLERMFSNNQRDYTKKNIFDKYFMECVNFHITKIPLR